MGQTRAEIAGRVDRVAGRAAQGQADAPHQHAPQIGPETGRQAIGGDAFRSDREAGHDQGDRGQKFGQGVAGKVADRRGGAENPKLQPRILGRGPMRQINQPDEKRRDESAGHLRGDIGQDRAVIARAHSQGNRDHRIEMGDAADRLAGQDAEQHRQSPGGGDDHPTAILRLGLLEQHTGDHPVAQQHQHQRAEEFSENRSMHHLIRSTRKYG